MNLTPYLEDLEKRIQPDEETRLEKEWLEFTDLQCANKVFTPARTPVAPSIDWPDACLNTAFNDMDLMLYLQLKTVSDTLSRNVGQLLCVRPNYGTCIIPSMFSAELLYLPDSANTLPGARPLKDKVEALRPILDERNVDYAKGLAPRVFAFGERFEEAVQKYPLLKRFVHLYTPDIQGPFALVDMLAGSELYYAFYDEPELVHASIDFFTDVLTGFVQKWLALHPSFDDAHAVEWGLLYKGKVMLRNDACVNISEKIYREFIMPYDARVYAAFGGAMHYCGRGDHYIPAASEIKGLNAVNLSQPHLNKMDTIYEATIQKGITLLALQPEEARRALESGVQHMNRVHASSFIAAFR